MIEILSLSTLYLSGNYLVVRQLSEILLNAEFSPGTDISFAYIFYAYTIAVPLVYIWLGLKSKELILIRTGIILEVAGVLSIRYYYSILPPETALILAGLVLSLTAWFTIRYLKVPRNGITLEDTPESRREEMEVLSSLVISQATSNLQSPDKPTQFGGGESGGGGAGGGY